jgi:hypothetical protein
MIDPQNARERLLPRSGWRPWQKPQPALEIDEWVAKQDLKRDDLPAHLEYDGCPYWYVRSGVVNAACSATSQAAQWAEKQEYIATALRRYGAEATAIAEASEALSQRISSFWQLHLGIDGNLFRYDHHKVTKIPLKPEIDATDVIRLLQQLAVLPETLQLQAVLDAAATARKPWLNTQGNVWKNVFVSYLGLIWSDVMGGPPANSDPFRDFVADAWASLDPDGDAKTSFDRTVTKVTRGFRSTGG